jgi:hypothetical protein
MLETYTIGSSPARCAVPSTRSVPRTLTWRMRRAVKGVDRAGVDQRVTAPHRLLDRGRVGDIADHGVQVGGLKAEWGQGGGHPPGIAATVRTLRRR